MILTYCTEVQGKKLLHWHLGQHKSHMHWRWADDNLLPEPWHGRRLTVRAMAQPSTDCLSQGTTADWPPEPWHNSRLTAWAMAQPPTDCLSHGTTADWLPEPWHNRRLTAWAMAQPPTDRMSHGTTADWLTEPWHNRRLTDWAMAQPPTDCLSHGTVLWLYNVSFFPFPRRTYYRTCKYEICSELSPISTVALCSCTDRGELKYWGIKTRPLPLFPSQTPWELACD